MLIYRLHVFADLLPYICTFSDCSDELRQFPSRSAWAEHEWENHRSYRIWACPECSVECCTSADWIEHVRKVHGRALASSQGTSAADAAARRRPRIIKDEKCHLCKRVLGTSQKDIKRHVGEHLEEVALMALPKENEDLSDETSISDHEASYPHGSVIDETPISAGSVSGKCLHQNCGRSFKDLKAHKLTHVTEGAFKCSVVSCEYHVKGFARKYDQNRHTLEHYKGTMVCGFCPGFGTTGEKTFNRSDIFKMHLTLLHGVAQYRPKNLKKPLPTKVRRRSSQSTADTFGFCSICSENYASAQEFYEHLDDCVLRAVQREEASETTNEYCPPEVAKHLAEEENRDRQASPSTQSDGKDQASLQENANELSRGGIQTMYGPTFHRDWTTDQQTINIRLPSIGEWYSSSRSLRIKKNSTKRNGGNIIPSDATQPLTSQIESLPMILNFTLHITSQNGITPFPPIRGSVQLKDSSAYHIIERVANDSVQKYCHSSRPRESWRFSNGKCILSEHQAPRPTYALNCMEDWKIICESLECWLTSQKNLHRNLDIHREYVSHLTHPMQFEAQVSTDNDPKSKNVFDETGWSNYRS